MSYRRRVPVPPERVFAVLDRLGGAGGYLFADPLWRLRGRIERWLGGRGIDDTRRTVVPRAVGDRFDFWIVEARRRPDRLGLRAELHMPGRGWLEFDVASRGAGSEVALTASFEPRGALGALYWFGLYPIHDAVFRGMLRALGRGRDRDAPAVRRSAPFRPVPSATSAPCRVGCPAGNDVRAWVSLVAQRGRLGIPDDEAYARAFAILADTNPFPATTGRVCPHPCETGCNRSPKDGAVAVHRIERFLGDWALERGLALPRLTAERRAETIGVVGSGPAGLSFAYQMARRGYAVTVHERAAAPGGMLRWGIPRYRLPEAVLEAEIRRIRDLGVDLVLDEGGGRGVDLDELRARHDAVFFAVGAQRGRRLGVPGEDLAGVRSGTDYLREVHEGRAPDLGRRVVVVGGGNTAIDAARVALRRGSSVTVLYRRGPDEMPAIRSEIAEAIEEGVAIEPWSVPIAIEARAGGGLAVRVQRTAPGAVDADGRPRPVPVPGAVWDLDADTLVAAVAQEPDWAGAESLASGGWARPDAEGRVGDGVWAGGDVVRPGIVSEAIGHGRRAAECVHARLRGVDPPLVRDAAIASGAVKPELYPDSPRVPPRRSSPADAIAHPDDEVHPGISAREFEHEVARCLSCGQCNGCERCWTYCVHDGFERIVDPAPGAYFRIDLDGCRGCGKCSDVCPCGFLGLDSTVRGPAG